MIHFLQGCVFSEFSGWCPYLTFFSISMFSNYPPPSGSLLYHLSIIYTYTLSLPSPYHTPAHIIYLGYAKLVLCLYLCGWRQQVSAEISRDVKLISKYYPRNCSSAGELRRPARFWQWSDSDLLGLCLLPHGHNVHCW